MLISEEVLLVGVWLVWRTTTSSWLGLRRRLCLYFS